MRIKHADNGCHPFTLNQAARITVRWLRFNLLPPRNCSVILSIRRLVIGNIALEFQFSIFGKI